MGYLKKAKQGDKVFGLVFGLGTITTVFDDGHYAIMVTFGNDQEVPYTQDGVPGWGKFKEQTLFYKDDIDLTNYDFTPIDKVLTPRKIIKFREKKKLEVRLPSGIWQKADKKVKKYVEELLENQKYHFFRKKS